MVNKPKIAGTNAEGWVRNYAQETYWPTARRLALAGKNDIGDIDLHPKIMVEVKASTRALLIGPWMRETDVQQYRKQADYGLLVIKTKGYGLQNAGRFLTVMRAGLAYKLLHDTNTIAATEHVLRPSYKLDPLHQLAVLEDQQNEVGNMYNMVTYRVRAEQDPDMFYSFMRLGPRLDLLNLAGYGTYLKGDTVEDQNTSDHL
jgi:hypothetical protein